MDLRILTLLMVSLALTQGTPQRALNSLHGSQSLSPGKLSGTPTPTTTTGEDPKRAKIMKQINKVNDDGSYTFGYEADDGSFRVETRSKGGVVKGKYGYVDANGELKVMEYIAGERTEASEAAAAESGSEESNEEKSSPVPRGPVQQVQQQRGPVPIQRGPVPVQRGQVQQRGPILIQRGPILIHRGQIPVQRAPVQIQRGPVPIQRERVPETPSTQQTPEAAQQEPVLRVLPKYLSRSTKEAPSIVLPPKSIQRPTQLPVAQGDQTFAAQTPSGKVTQVKYNNDDEDEDEKSQEDESPKDVNNGQYFRALPTQPTQSGAGGTPRPQPPQAPQGGEGPRYVPTHQLGGFPPQQYAGPPQQPQSPYQGFSSVGGPQSFRRPVLQSGPQQPGQSQPLIPYEGQQSFDEDSYSGGPQSQQFGRPGNPNVQVQFRGSPPDIQPQHQQSLFPGQQPQQQSVYAGQQPQSVFAGQQPQQFAGFGSPPGSGRQFSGRQFGEQQQQQQPQEGDDGQYVPNVNLDGFSEDADEDGYVDEPNNGLGQGATAQAQEKQGVAVKAVGPGRGAPPNSDAYRPQVLGPQGVLQGGKVNIGREQPGQSQGQPGQNPFPQLSEEQIQQLFAGLPQQGIPQQQYLGQQQQQQGIPQQYLGQQQQQQGIPQQYLGQQFGGGFPSQGQLQQQPQFLGQQNPSLQGQYIPGGQSSLGQQNPSLQGQYVPGGQPGQQFTGFPGIGQQYIPQQFQPQSQSQQFQPQSQQFQPQGQQFQPQGQQFQPQSQQFQPQSQQFQPQGQYLQGGFQDGIYPGGGFQGSQLGSPQQGGIQSSGLPFDFNPFGGLPGSQGPTGQGQFLSQGPSQAQLGQSGPSQLQGLSQAQLLQLQGLNQQQGGFSDRGQGNNNGFSQQLGGGLPRPVQAGSSSGGVFSGEARKAPSPSPPPSKST